MLVLLWERPTLTVYVRSFQVVAGKRETVLTEQIERGRNGTI